MTEMVITYADDSKTPAIKDTGLVAIKNLLKDAKKGLGADPNFEDFIPRNVQLP